MLVIWEKLELVSWEDEKGRTMEYSVLLSCRDRIQGVGWVSFIWVTFFFFCWVIGTKGLKLLWEDTFVPLLIGILRSTWGPKSHGCWHYMGPIWISHSFPFQLIEMFVLWKLEPCHPLSYITLLNYAVHSLNYATTSFHMSLPTPLSFFNPVHCIGSEPTQLSNFETFFGGKSNIGKFWFQKDSFAVHFSYFWSYYLVFLLQRHVWMLGLDVQMFDFLFC